MKHIVARLPYWICLCVLSLWPGMLWGQSTSHTIVDYVVLIDVSGSMAGKPGGSGNVDIFPEVQTSVIDFIGELEPGVTIQINPFSDGLKGGTQFEIRTSADTERAQAYVQALEATGSSTHVYKSLRDAFAQYSAFRTAQPEDRVGVLLVYTDGQDNGPEHRTMADVMSDFELNRQDYDWIYYSTLGVELGADEQTALEQSPFATYNPNPSGEVRPLQIIEPRYRLLDFGNLMTEADAQRTLRFNILSKNGLPENYRLSASAQFDTVAQQGVAVEVSPADVNPTAETEIGLDLVNVETLGDGNYTGDILFASSDPSVLVVPNSIRARFRFEPRRLVSLMLPRGAERLNFGTLDPFRADSVVAHEEIALSYSRAALEKGGAFTVQVEQNPEAEQLPDDVWWVNGTPGIFHHVAVDEGPRLTVGIRLTEAIEPGRYQGILVLLGDDVEVEEASQAIPWILTVAERPWSLWQWLGLVLGLVMGVLAVALVAGGALTGKWPFWKKDLLRGRLIVVAPPKTFNYEIMLKGKRDLHLGTGAEELTDAGGRVLIRPDRAGKTVRTKVIVEDGSALLVRQGEAAAVPISSETLRDGDRLVLPPYTLEYSRH